MSTDEFTKILSRLESGDATLTKISYLRELAHSDWALLAKALINSCVVDLDLSYSNIEGEAAVNLINILPQTKIEHFSLDSCGHKEIVITKASGAGFNLEQSGVGEAAISALIKILPDTNIINISLAGNRINSKQLDALGLALTKSKVTHINLDRNEINDIGAFAKFLKNTKIIDLNLALNDISRGVNSLVALASSKVETLNLEFNKIGPSGAEALGKSLVGSQIKKLNLRYCEIGDTGLNGLCKYLSQSKIIVLNLSSNNISAQGVSKLAEVLPFTKIKEINLESNTIRTDGTINLISVLSKTELTFLNLGQTAAGGEVLTQLFKELEKTKIENLGLSYHSIYDKHLIELVQILERSQLKALDLSSNQITDEGASKLAEYLPKSKLISLNLARNKIGVVGAAKLAKALPQSQVEDLNLENNEIAVGVSNEFVDAATENPDLVINMEGAEIDHRFIDQTLNKNIKQNQSKVLKFQWNKVSKFGVDNLAKLLVGSQIEVLDLKGSSIGDMGASDLAKFLPRTRLTTLGLNGNNINGYGFGELVSSLPKTKIENLDLEKNRIGDENVVKLFAALINSKVTVLNLCSNNISPKGIKQLSKHLANTKITELDLSYNDIGKAGVQALAKVLPQSKISTLILKHCDLKSSAISALAKVLPKTCITTLSLEWNEIGASGARILANILQDSNITSLNLKHNRIGNSGLLALAPKLNKSKINTLDLSDNDIKSEGVIALSKVLPQTHLRKLNLAGNYISEAVQLAKALAQSNISEIDLSFNSIYTNDPVVDLFLEAIKSSFTITSIVGLPLNEEQKAILENHQAINKLLSKIGDEPILDKDEYIQELEAGALFYINQPLDHLGENTYEKPKKLLLEAAKQGSVQAIYHLANLYSEQIGDPNQAKKYYQSAAEQGHKISMLCLEILEQKGTVTELTFDNLNIKMPRKYSSATVKQKLAEREAQIANLQESSNLVSNCGISLAALNELKNKENSVCVYLAKDDFETQEKGYLCFNRGQTIYINQSNDIRKNFAAFVKNDLGKSFIPYNRDKHGKERATTGIISYETFLKCCQQKPREVWTAEDICNAVIIPSTSGYEAAYVDTLLESERGKPFEGYILSYARSTKFSDILKSLNERFKDKKQEEIFVWIDLIGINQHAWLTMKSKEIGKVLEVSLTQLFTHISSGRLIHFDKAQPTNLTRSWCLVELLSCLKAQEHTIAQTEICMTSAVQAEILFTNIQTLLNSLDSSKAECFNPEDKKAIDAEIMRALTNESESEISMDVAYARLNNVVKSWLVAKFLPDFKGARRRYEEAPVKAEIIKTKNRMLTFSATTNSEDLKIDKNDGDLTNHKAGAKPNCVIG